MLPIPVRPCLRIDPVDMTREPASTPSKVCLKGSGLDATFPVLLELQPGALLNLHGMWY